MTNLLGLPEAVFAAAAIDPATIVRLDWPFPIWSCDAGGERVVIASRRGRTDESLDWEAALLDGLEDAGFPASRAARIFDGNDYVFADDMHFSARTWVPGRMLAEFDDPDLSAVGRFIGKYHDAASSIDLPQRPGIEPLADVLPRPDDDDMFRVLGDRALVHEYRARVEEVLPRVAGADHSLPLHGDFTTRNIAAQGSSAFVGLIDFGMAHIGCPAIELAYALASTRPTYDNIDHDLHKVEALIRGYSSVRPLEKSDLRLIVDFGRARPLLGLAIYALEHWDPPGATRVSLSFGRVRWLTENRDELLAAIARGVSSR